MKISRNNLYFTRKDMGPHNNNAQKKLDKKEQNKQQLKKLAYILKNI